MSAVIFVDANVFVYARDASETGKQQSAAGWLSAVWRTRSGRVSVQVLEEFYVTATTKLDPGMPVADARRDVGALAAWDPLPLTADLLEDAWRIEDRYRFSFWDALILSAAQRSGCTHVLTEDLQDGQRIEGLLVVDPFQHAPESVLGPIAQRDDS